MLTAAVLVEAYESQGTVVPCIIIGIAMVLILYSPHTFGNSVLTLSISSYSDF